MRKMLLAILCSGLLIGCSPTKQIVKTEYVYPTVPELPADPIYFPVQWNKGDQCYYLTEQQAKDLLKNMAIKDAYEQELKEIITGLNKERK